MDQSNYSPSYSPAEYGSSSDSDQRPHIDTTDIAGQGIYSPYEAGSDSESDQANLESDQPPGLVTNSDNSSENEMEPEGNQPAGSTEIASQENYNPVEASSDTNSDTESMVLRDLYLTQNSETSSGPEPEKEKEEESTYSQTLIDNLLQDSESGSETRTTVEPSHQMSEAAKESNPRVRTNIITDEQRSDLRAEVKAFLRDPSEMHDLFEGAEGAPNDLIALLSNAGLGKQTLDEELARSILQNILPDFCPDYELIHDHTVKHAIGEAARVFIITGFEIDVDEYKRNPRKYVYNIFGNLDKSIYAELKITTIKLIHLRNRGNDEPTEGEANQLPTLNTLQLSCRTAGAKKWLMGRFISNLAISTRGEMGSSWCK